MEHAERPELIAVCRNCKHDDCVGLCKEYKDKLRELTGKPPAREKHKFVPLECRDTKYEAFGESHTLMEWHKITGISYNALWRRIRVRGWDVEAALTRECVSGAKTRVFLSADGKRQSVRQWAEELGISCHTIYARYARGYSDRECLYGRVIGN